MAGECAIKKCDMTDKTVQWNLNCIPRWKKIVTNDTIAVVNVCQISNSVLFWFVCGVKAKEPAMRLFIKDVGF